MEEYITKVSILKDALVITREKVKDSEVILITLGGLGNKYESFVTSITIRFDPNMTFSSLCELLMDQEMCIQKARFLNLAVVNVAAKTNPKSDDGSSQSKSEIKCQICSKKAHTMLNCYNHLNITRFQLTHGRELSPGPTRSNGSAKHSANLVTLGVMLMWYPDSGATLHITLSLKNI